jgi:hypothetical protein
MKAWGTWQPDAFRLSHNPTPRGATTNSIVWKYRWKNAAMVLCFTLCEDTRLMRTQHISSCQQSCAAHRVHTADAI